MEGQLGYVWCRAPAPGDPAPGTPAPPGATAHCTLHTTLLHGGVKN